MRGSRRIGLLAVSVACLFAFMATSASARDLFYQKATKEKLLPDAQGSNGGVKGFGYPIELVNSGELKLEAGALKNNCSEGEIDTYLNKNTEALGAEAILVAGQFECENPTFLVTPSEAKAVFAAGASEATVTNLKFLIQALAQNCVFEPKAAGIKGTWTNALGGEEGLGSTIAFSGVEVESKSGGLCPATGKLTATFGVETFLQTDAENVFDSEQVVYE